MTTRSTSCSNTSGGRCAKRFDHDVGGALVACADPHAPHAEPAGRAS